jgi:hypothetical protein
VVQPTSGWSVSSKPILIKRDEGSSLIRITKDAIGYTGQTQ